MLGKGLGKAPFAINKSAAVCDFEHIGDRGGIRRGIADVRIVINFTWSPLSDKNSPAHYGKDRRRRLM